nr:MAG TPA: hypothetical protein [Caudoviricetes sp.]
MHFINMEGIGYDYGKAIEYIIIIQTPLSL